MSKVKQSTDWFGVNTIKAFPDPSGKLDRREMIVPLSEYPADFGLGPNPREPNPNSKVSLAIRDTLETKPEVFHLLNRGITIIAKGIEYDNKSKRVRLKLGNGNSDGEYGILDGGNTNERIKLWRDGLSPENAAKLLSSTFVNVQVLIPQHPVKDMSDTLNDVKEARNTSVQVKEKSLADARGYYELLKKAVADEPYAEKISWHEGDGGTVDVLDLVGLLVMFYPPYAEVAHGKEPNDLYGRRNRALDAYLDYADSEEHCEAFARWIELAPTLVRLFDAIQQGLPEAFEGHFGRISAVRIYDEDKYFQGSPKHRKTPLRSKFLGADMDYSVPAGFVYPLFAGFRVLLQIKGKKVGFRVDPVDFWERNSKLIVAQFKPHMQQLGYDPGKIGASPTSYQACRHAVSDCFKNELLAEAGIEL